MSIHKMFRLFFPEQRQDLIRKKYGIPNKVNFKIAKKQSGWFVITSPDLPGLICQCKDLDDFIEVCNDAVLTYFDVPKKESDCVFNEFNLEGVGQLKRTINKKVQYA